MASPAVARAGEMAAATANAAMNARRDTMEAALDMSNRIYRAICQHGRNAESIGLAAFSPPNMLAQIADAGRDDGLGIGLHPPVAIKHVAAERSEAGAAAAPPPPPPGLRPRPRARG